MFTPPESWRLPTMGRCVELGRWFAPPPRTDRILLTSLHLPQGLCHNGAAMARKGVSLLSLSTRLAAVGPRLAHNSAWHTRCSKCRRPRTERPRLGEL